VTTSASSDLDRDLAPIVEQSWIVRLVMGPVHHLETAWRHATVRRRTDAVYGAIAQLPRGQQLRLGSVAGAVAMTVHVGLVLADARTVEPLALLLPAAIVAVCIAVWAGADGLARALERRE
jgi:hypothetical protein